MQLRPNPARWFETYVPRNETVQALEALAATGMVQLELDSKLAEPLDLEHVRTLIDRFQTLRQRYADLLPAVDSSPRGIAESPECTAEKALRRLQRWSAPVEQSLKRQTGLEIQRNELLLLEEFLNTMREAARSVAPLSERDQLLYKGVFACPHTRTEALAICAAVSESLLGSKHNFFIVAGQTACGNTIEAAYRSESCARVPIPDWLPLDPTAQKVLVEARIDDVATEIYNIVETLKIQKSDPSVAAALADIDLLVWYLDHTEHLTSIQKLCHVTGWTTAEKSDALQEAFLQHGVHGVIRFAQPPEYSKVPVSMRLPWWATPFQFFLNMLGTPDSTEIDPSKLLPFVVPLLFGYMFPDVGHGLMLILFSVILHRHWPEGRFFIPCGLSAIVFGIVFGEVFGLAHLIDPLWIRPLEQPLKVLTAPLLLGAGLLMLGLVFNGTQAVWRGETRQWLLLDAAVLALYATLLAGLFVPEFLWLAVVVLTVFLAVQLAVLSSHSLAQLGRNIGLLLQSAFELALNTLSFLRVGAFALAHAGLTTAILGLTAGVSDDVLRLLLLTLGHILIVALEGLVAFVQTTRLVLFEFFMRFLRAKGREFLPMSEPPYK